MSGLSHRQRIILAETRTVTGTLSVLASSIIIYKIFLRYKEQRKNISNVTSVNNQITTYHRLLFGMSVLDILTSSWQAASTLAVPASSGAVFGQGTTFTCSAQGFFFQLSNATPVYAAALTTYFMLKIRYNVSDDVLRQRYEFWFHAVPLVFAFGSASVGAALKLFNPIGGIPELGCWIAPFPAGCHVFGGCTRGYKIAEYFDMYTWLFSYGWLFAGFVVVLVNNALIYCAIRTQERRNASYLAAILASTPQSSTPSSTLSTIAESKGIRSQVAVMPSGGDSSQEIAPPSVGDEETQNDAVRSDRRDNSSKRKPARRSTSRTVFVQSILYVCAAFFTVFWAWLPWLVLKPRGPGGVTPQGTFFLAFMVNISTPFQGVWTLFIFVRLQYLRLRVTEKDWSRLRCVKFCFFSPETR